MDTSKDSLQKQVDRYVDQADKKEKQRHSNSLKVAGTALALGIAFLGSNKFGISDNSVGYIPYLGLLVGIAGWYFENSLLGPQRTFLKLALPLEKQILGLDNKHKGIAHINMRGLARPWIGLSLPNIVALGTIAASLFALYVLHH